MFEYLILIIYIYLLCKKKFYDSNVDHITEQTEEYETKKNAS